MQLSALSPSRRARRVVGVLAVAAAGLAVAGCSGTVGFDDGSGDKARGKTLFTQACGSCHTLADAGTSGTIGPDLDAAFFQYRADAAGADPEDADFAAQLADPDVESTVRQIVRGQIAYPVVNPSSGAPGMPADLVTGDDAAAVAAYVASVAGLQPPGSGQPTAGGDGAAGGGGSEGKSVFASAGCGGCHTLQDAGTTGTIGPNLDDAKPSLELAVDRVTNGRGGMPAFKGQLTEAQIRAVAQYVASAAG